MEVWPYMLSSLCSTFRNNVGKRGTIFVIGNVIAIEGDTLLEGSVGPALRVSGLLGDVIITCHV